jgi:thiamine biosynthesis protein ThiS
MDVMNLTINGEPQLSSAETLGALVEQLGMKPDRVAIELNREIVPRDQWPQTPLHDGDHLEIVHFVGGGSFSGPIQGRFGNPFPNLLT